MLYNQLVLLLYPCFHISITSLIMKVTKSGIMRRPKALVESLDQEWPTNERLLAAFFPLMPQRATLTT